MIRKNYCRTEKLLNSPPYYCCLIAPSQLRYNRMCGRFTLKTPEQVRLAQYCSDFPALKPRYNIAPSQDVLTIVQRGDSREAALLQWGLIPYWSKEAKGIINARVETIEDKPSFSESFKNRRCLIVADGFYEWERHGKI